MTTKVYGRLRASLTIHMVHPRIERPGTLTVYARNLLRIPPGVGQNSSAQYARSASAILWDAQRDNRGPKRYFAAALTRDPPVSHVAKARGLLC
jgi:hypothetical protein